MTATGEGVDPLRRSNAAGRAPVGLEVAREMIRAAKAGPPGLTQLSSGMTSGLKSATPK